MSRWPADRPASAFFLQPLSTTKGNIWYSRTPCGHNTLQRVVPELMKQAGYFTNHSLRAIAATRLFENGVDEQLIRDCTGHSSKEGVRAYKQTTTKLYETIFDIRNSDRINTKTISEVTSKPTDSNG